ncbi:MAG: hypothetical protein JKY01_11805 [Pseudomonadales bacterium]|nr:hypothetical protein [Pseudomonadales bacterium]
MSRVFILLLLLFLSACTQNPVQVEMYPSGKGESRGELPASNRRIPPPFVRGEERLSPPQVALLNQAEKHLALHQENLAAAKLERAIRINPHAVRPYRLLAELRLQQRNYRAAAAFARKGLAVVAKKGNPRSFRREKARLENILSRALSTRRAL